MHSLSLTDLQTICGRVNQSLSSFPTFIETGTHEGATIIAIAPYFTHCHTIELSHMYYNLAKSNASGINNIVFHHGDSAAVLPNLLDDIQDNVIFYLDGHWSSGDTARGSKDVPLIEELQGINEKCKKNAIIIVDDYRLFGTTHSENWGEIKEQVLMDCVKQRLRDFFVFNDRFVMVISEKMS